MRPTHSAAELYEKTFYAVIRLFLIAFLFCLTNLSFAKAQDAPTLEAVQDEVDPASLLPFWTNNNLLSFGPPYTLSDHEREKYGGSFGVDLSHYSFDLSKSPKCKTSDGYGSPDCSCSIDWSVLEKNHLKFAYTKATDGAGRDLSFPMVWDGLLSSHRHGDIFRGAYHFLRPKISADIQAKAFLNALDADGDKKIEMLPPALDIEWSSKHILPGTPEFDDCLRKTKTDKGQYYCDMWYQMTPDQIVALASRWAEIVSKATGRPVILYTNVKAWWNPVIGSIGKKFAAAHSIWVSRYTSLGPSYSASWTAEGGSPKWKMPPLPVGLAYPQAQYDVAHFWQFSEKATVKEPMFSCHGQPVNRNIDMDWVPVDEAEYPSLFGVAPR